MKPHKHAAVIHAYADGARIEMYHQCSGKWERNKHPTFENCIQYRVAKEFVRYRLYEHRDGDLYVFIESPKQTIEGLEQQVYFKRWLHTEWQEVEK